MTVEKRNSPLPSTEITKDFESLILDLGGFSRYQWLIFALSSLGSFVIGFAIVNIGFVGRDIDHRCYVPRCDIENSTSFSEEFLNFTTPIDEENERFDRCNYYKPFFENASQAVSYDSDGTTRADGSFTTFCTTDVFRTNQTLNCSSYIYDHSVMYSTTASEFGLACDRSWLQPYSGASYMLGMFLGAITLGDISDRFGRRWGYIISTLIALVGGFVSALSVNYPMFLITRVICGAGNIAIYLVAYVMCVEFVPPKYRAPCGVVLSVPFALGEACVAPLAYFFRDWRILQVSTTIPAIVLLVVIYLFSDESIRWLVAQGRVKEAQKLVEKCARLNGKTVTSDMLLVLDKENPYHSSTTSTTDLTGHDESQVQTQPTPHTNGGLVEPNKRSVLSLFQLPNTRKRTLNIGFSWVVVTMTYYGLSANSGNLGGNVYVNFVAIMLIEVPSNVLCYLLIDRLGRKGTIVFSFLLGGIGCLIGSAYVSHKELEIVVMTVSMIGKCGATMAFSVVYIWTAEIFSTEYRAIGVGFCSMLARIGGITAPFIADLGRTHWKPFPLMIFGILAISAGLLNILLPETVGMELPQTVEEGENLGSDQSIFYFTFFPKMKKNNKSTNTTVNQTTSA